MGAVCRGISRYPEMGERLRDAMRSRRKRVTEPVPRAGVPRPEVEPAWHAHEDRRAALLRALPDLLFRVSREGVYLDYHAASPELLLVSPERFLGRTVTQVMPPEIARQTMEAIARALETNEMQRFEYALEIGDEVRWFEARIVAGGVDEALAIVREVTELRRTVHALQESEERFRLAIEESPLGMVLVGTDLRMLKVNKAICRMLNYAEEELVGHSFTEITHPEDVDRDLALAKRAFAGEIPGYELSKRFLRRNGEEVWINLTAVVVRDAQGVVRYGLEMIEDTTERMRAEQARRQLEQEVLRAHKLESLGVMAGGMAGTFGDLLTTILGNVGLAMLRSVPDSPVMAYLKEIQAAAERAAEIARQMRSYVRSAPTDRRPADLSRLIAEMADLLSGMIPRQVLTNYRLTPDLPLIEANTTELRQVVMNLVTNAVEAIGDQPGFIVIETGIEKSPAGEADRVVPLPFVYLQVTDTGRGMDDETRAQLFAPFFTTKGAGGGLGLPSVQGIVRAHRGSIHVDSRPGHGTTVRVLFPTTE